MSAEPAFDRLRGWLRPLLGVLAVLFAVSTIIHATCWVLAQQQRLGVELGFNAPVFLEQEHALLIDSVVEGSPAQRAGLRRGDRLVEIDRAPLESARSQEEAWRRHQPGDSVRLTIQRPGQEERLLLVGFFRRASGSGTRIDFLGRQLHEWLPLPFVVVGLTVLFLRLEDRTVWLLALLFGSFTTISGFPRNYEEVTPSLREVVHVYHSVFLAALGSLFYCFFAIFPARSSLDRRAPWLKWAALAIGVWMGLSSIPFNELRLPAPIERLVPDPTARGPFWVEFPLIALGLVSLALTYVHTADLHAKRRIRVVFWGTVAAVVPTLIVALAGNLRVSPPGWFLAATDALVFLFPLSFAYAVVKHRVLDVPDLLKRSARYLLVQRGFALSLSAASIAVTLLFAFSLAARLQPVVDVTGPSGIVLGAAFGTVVLWGGLQVHRRVSERIDRAFFRSAYDARIILENLAEQARTTQDRGELACLLARQLRDALKPVWLGVYLADKASRMVPVAEQSVQPLLPIDANAPPIAELAERAEPWEVPSAPAEAGPFAALGADCVVPIVGRSRRLTGMVVLGSRLSEEPYSGEDKRLLASVANQAGIALDNITFAEELAERMERERRDAREMEIAREVQSRLLPQAAPVLRTVQCAARCIQARSVGGDYYDFLDLDGHGAGFVLADVSGKGVHAALLSASLQAHLRSQSAAAPTDPVRLLAHVNDILWKSTAAQHYATLFFGVYDDAARSLCYVNCGHNPPVLLRNDGTVERLDPTAPVIGLFDQWRCTAREVRLCPGDLLAIFSDGITEATRGEDEEFGEARFLADLRAHARCPADAVVAAVLESVQAFSAGQQSDDLTLLIARAI